MIQSALGSSSKNSNLAHHQQRGIVTSIFPQHFMRFVPNNILRFCFKIKFNIFLISKLMDTFLELANSGVKFKIRFAERGDCIELCCEQGGHVDTWRHALNYDMRRGIIMHVEGKTTLITRNWAASFRRQFQN